ncbi:MAG: hypothetical protein ACREXX_16110 [Gammaproteobacteria bacterium]
MRPSSGRRFQIGCRTSKRPPLLDALIAAAAGRGAYLVHRDGHLAAMPLELVEQIQLPEPVSG